VQLRGGNVERAHPTYIKMLRALPLLLLPLARSLELGAEWVSWPMGLCDVVPLSYGGWTAPAGAPAPTDADGWPTSDAYAVLFDYVASPYDPAGAVPNVWGTYTVSFSGSGTITLYPGLGRILNSTFSPDTFTTLAYVQLDPADHTPGLVVGVYDSVRARGAPLGSGFTRLQVLQPGCALLPPPLRYTPSALAALAPFRHARVHEWHGTNSIPVTYPDTVAWGQRRALSDARWADGAPPRPLAVGAPWEASLLLAAAANVSLWVNVPVYADAGYVAALAALLARGNASARVPALAAPHLYLEHGNELWLDAPNAPLNYAYNFNASVAEVAAGGSPLNSDGATEPRVWAARRHVKRLREVALVFGAALRAAGSSVALRPVYAWMQDYAAEAAGALAWLEATYGAGEAARVLWGYAVNSYRGPGVYPGGSAPLPQYARAGDVAAALAAAGGASVAPRAASARVAADFGLALASYEGSAWSEPDGRGFNSAGFNATIGAVVDWSRGEGAAQEQAQDVLGTWAQAVAAAGGGGGLAAYNFYALSSAYGTDYGACFGLAEDVTAPRNSSKYRGALALLARG
jgi:hypothetical protein